MRTYQNPAKLLEIRKSAITRLIIERGLNIPFLEDVFDFFEPKSQITHYYDIKIYFLVVWVVNSQYNPAAELPRIY